MSNVESGSYIPLDIRSWTFDIERMEDEQLLKHLSIFRFLVEGVTLSDKQVLSMSLRPFIIVFLLVSLFVIAGSNFRQDVNAIKQTYRWTGAWMPMRLSAGDGITELDTKIGRFIHFPDKGAYLKAIQNINKKFPGSTPWATWTVGDLSRAIPQGTTLTDEQHDAYLSLMDQHGIEVFLEVFPFKADPAKNLPVVEAAAEIDKWLNKFKHHKSVVGVGVELEYFGKATDALAAEWDRTIKRHNSKYRMFLRHYSKDFMPPSYRGDGDLIFICDASESTIPELNAAFASWANHFTPTACAFQIGYPADEDGMNGSKDLGWWRLKDPLAEWGDGILPLIKDEKQEIGLIWVTAKSGKSYNKDWDLTK